MNRGLLQILPTVLLFAWAKCAEHAEHILREVGFRKLNALFSLLGLTLAVTIVAAWLIIHRYRVIRLEELRDEEALAALISSRLNKDDGSN